MSEGGEPHTYRVVGMTCEHCVAAVSAEVGELPGVSAVEVKLAGGELVVRGADMRDEAVRGAVEAAGYGLIEPHLDNPGTTTLIPEQADLTALGRDF
jgi:copper chaperone CopZ